LTWGPLHSAVLFLTYRRFPTADLVFETIRKARPPRLYFASNAPNPKNQGEELHVQTVRALTNRVDWDCELKTRFLDKHLSIKESISSSIDWFFDNEDEGIILEDDCLPDQSFFPYCDELLFHYRDNLEIMMISGCNFQDGIKRGSKSYYFSNHFHIWGWATWKISWQKYDTNMVDWPQIKKKKYFKNLFPSYVIRSYWYRLLQIVYENRINTWDYQWLYTCWKNKGVAIIPNINLISNIGFGKDSNFTKDEDSNASNLLVRRMSFPMKHYMLAKNIEPDLNADLYTSKYHYNITLYKVILNNIKEIIRKWL